MSQIWDVEWISNLINHHASADGVRVEINSSAASKEHVRRVKHFMVPCSYQQSYFSEVVQSGAHLIEFL
jgi:hypothetical protein